MIQWIPGFVGFFCMSFLAADGSALEVELKYDRYPDQTTDEDFFRPTDFHFLDKSMTPPEGKWKLPQLKSKAPAFALAELGDGKRLLILDRREGKDPFYNLLYFDADGDGDLTDDSPIKPMVPEGTDEVRTNVSNFPILDTTSKIGGKEVPYAFRIVAFQFGEMGQGENSEQLLFGNLGFGFLPQCCYRGELRIRSQTFRFALSDGNVNGRFDDFASLPAEEGRGRLDPLYPRGDHLYLTSREKLDYEDIGFLGDLLHVRESLFRITVDVAEKRMILAPVLDGLAALKFSMPVERLALVSEDGKRHITVLEPGDGARIPAGRWRLLSYRALRKDAEGDQWVVAGSGTAETPAVAIVEGGAEALSFGEPYEAFAFVPDRFYVDLSSEEALKKVPIQFRLEGRSRDVVTDLRRIEGKKTSIPLSSERDYRAREPTYKIVKTTGEVVAQGSFTYG